MTHNPATRRILSLVSNFQDLTRLLQAQHAVFSRWHLDDPSLSEGGVPLGLLSGCFAALRPSLPLRRNLDTDFLQSGLRAAQRSSAFLCPSPHCPTLPSLSPYSNLTSQPHEALDSLRSFDLERIDRSDQSASLHLQIPKLAAFNFYQLCCGDFHHPAGSLLAFRTDTETHSGEQNSPNNELQNAQHQNHIYKNTFINVRNSTSKCNVNVSKYKNPRHNHTQYKTTQ